jgi:hypothetical protein
LLPLVQLADGMSACIQDYDRRIEELATEKYGQTKLLRQAKGVGPIISLAYVLTLEKPRTAAAESRENELRTRKTIHREKVWYATTSTVFVRETTCAWSKRPPDRSQPPNNPGSPP